MTIIDVNENGVDIASTKSSSLLQAVVANEIVGEPPLLEQVQPMQK